MKRFTVFSTLLIILLTTSCNLQKTTTQIADSLKDNEELKAMYKADQGDRMVPDIDWSVVSKRDEERRERVYELLDSKLVQTSDDYANAAMIFQHGRDTIDYGMAVKLMRKAIELNPERDKWLLAAAIDRELMEKGKPQIYGTQFMKKGMDAPWEHYELDPTQVTDEERKEYGVETLAQQKMKLMMMNKRDLNELLIEGKSIPDLIALIKNSNVEDSEFNVSEGGINMLGYQLMGEGKNEDALKIFKLNTELYADAYNTYDSYGECLVKIGRVKEGIAAYKKSLELNPGNTNATKVLAELEK